MCIRDRSFSGLSLAPLSLGSTAPSATNATRPSPGSSPRRCSASSAVSTWSLAFSTSTPPSGAGMSPLRTTSGSSSTRTILAARASTLRPCAGRPTAMRASMYPGSTTIEVRGRTTWEVLCISSRPLPPEPRFPRTTRRISLSTLLVRKSSKATLRTGFANRSRSKGFSLVRIRIREGGAKGSRCTLSTNRTKGPKS